MSTEIFLVVLFAAVVLWLLTTRVKDDPPKPTRQGETTSKPVPAKQSLGAISLQADEYTAPTPQRAQARPGPFHPPASPQHAEQRSGAQIGGGGPMRRWEYLWTIVSCEPERRARGFELGRPHRWRIEVDGDSQYLEHGLDLLGKQGWELVATHVSQKSSWEGGYYPDAMYVFKRPLEEPAD